MFYFIKSIIYGKISILYALMHYALIKIAVIIKVHDIILATEPLQVPSQNTKVKLLNL